MLISEKNQYSKSGYHRDSSLKTHFHVSKITKSDKIVKKKANLSRICGKVENAILRQYLYNSLFTIPSFFLT